MLDILNFLVFTWLTIWATFSIWKIIKGDHDSILVTIVIFYIFFGIPLFLDVFVGTPQYNLFPGIRLAINDKTTSIIYCIYVSVIPVIWWFTGRSKKQRKPKGNNLNNIEDEFVKLSRFKPLFYVLVVSPIFVLMFAPDPSIYLKYGATALGLLPSEILQYHQYITISTLVSVISVAGLLLIKDKLRLSNFIILLPWIIISIWLNGKRAIVFIACLVLTFVFWKKGFLKGLKLLTFSIFIIGFLVAFSYIYQSQLRFESLNIQDTSSVYENFRMDFGRDNVTKMTIFAENNPDKIRILEYRGESVLFDLTMFIPRAIWPHKPWPYSIYFTSAMLMIPVNNYGWGMATSWLEESIANFGLFGMLLGPLLISFICRLGDAQRNTVVSSLTLLIANLFILFEFSAFSPFFFLWLFLVVNTARKRRKNRVKNELLN